MVQVARLDRTHDMITASSVQIHVIDLSLPAKEAAAAILHACVTTGFFYGEP